MFKTTGCGNITESVPDNNPVISHFEGEGEKCELSCVVKCNDIQTDTVWSYKNGSAKLLKVNGDHNIFYIYGNYRPKSQSHYSNHLQIKDCSVWELDGITLYCGSHANLEQAFFNLKVCGELIGHKLGLCKY